MTTKLLAVDDSKTMRKVLEITFAGNTYDSKIVGSAEEAMASLREGPPQLVVVDGHLGGNSGYDLCRQIKDAAPQVKVVLLSSKQRPYDPGQGSSAGVDEHFDKPFDSTKFLDKLSQIELSAAGAPAAAAPAPVDKPAPIAVEPRPAAALPTAMGGSASRPAAPPLSPAAKPAVAQSMPAAVSPKPAVVQPKAVSPAKPIAEVPKPIAEVPKRATAKPAATAVAAVGGMSEKLGAMGLSPEQVQGVLALSREVVEQVVWEVVPQMAEMLIKEEIARLTTE